jgi:hypothetical protein
MPTPILGDKNQVILAFIFGVRQTVLGMVHKVLLLVLTHQATVRRTLLTLAMLKVVWVSSIELMAYLS